MLCSIRPEDFILWDTGFKEIVYKKLYIKELYKRAIYKNAI